MTKTPLSQASGKKKLLVAGPLAILFAFLSGTPKFGSVAKMLSVALAAYAIVGLIEVLLGSRLQRASESWSRLPSWKKAIASIVVIVAFLSLAISSIPYLASL